MPRNSGNMRFVLLLVCAFAAFAMISADEVTGRLASIFVIPEEEARKCVEKTAVTVEDLQAMALVARQKSDSGVDQEKLRKTGCLFHCIWQKQGWVSGTSLQLDNIRRIVDVHTRNDTETRQTYYDIITTCNQQVQGVTGHCEMIRDFSVCLLKEMPHTVTGDAHSSHS